MLKTKYLRSIGIDESTIRRMERNNTYKEQYNNLKIKINNKFHDRFIVIDNKEHLISYWKTLLSFTSNTPAAFILSSS